VDNAEDNEREGEGKGEEQCGGGNDGG